MVASASITSDYNGEDISCNGLTDGTATSSIVGGTSGYTYSWDNGATTDAISGLSAGTYTVTITDANGCSDIETVTLTEPALLSNSYTSTDADCNVSNGTAQITSLGGTSGYTYSWSHDAMQTGNSSSNIPAGITNVVVTDTNGCSDNIALNIASVNQPIGELDSVDVLCYGDNTGEAAVINTTGNGPFTYDWLDALGAPIGQTGTSASNLLAGTYFVGITDVNNCLGTETIVVNEPATAVTGSVLSSQDPLCFEDLNGAAEASGIGGTGNLSYEWNTTPLQTGTVASGLGAGTYTVTITDQNGCQYSENVTLNDPTLLTASIIEDQYISCFGLSDGELTVSTTGGTSPLTYSWSESSTTASIIGLGVATYDVTVTDSNNCVATDSYLLLEPDVLEVTAGLIAEINCEISEGEVYVTVLGGSPSYTYSWSNGSSQQDLTNVPSGDYSLLVTDANGCEESIDVSIACTYDLNIPEIITPDGGGENEFFYIEGLENYQTVILTIYNRWGTEVYHRDPYTNDWSGQSESFQNVGGDQLPDGTYYYLLQLDDERKTGYVYLKTK